MVFDPSSDPTEFGKDGDPPNVGRSLLLTGLSLVDRTDLTGPPGPHLAGPAGVLVEARAGTRGYETRPLSQITMPIESDDENPSLC
jgi:hypothetical protein